MPGVGFGAGIERLVNALEGAPDPEDEGIDVFYVVAEGADRAAVLAKIAALRAEGVRADTDFAGRSVKGQLTHAQKRAAGVAIRGAEGWTLRRRGEQDRSGATLKELL